MNKPDQLLNRFNLKSISRRFFPQENLEKKLIRENKTRWLDIGCGGNFSPGFHYLDFYSTVEISEEIKSRYFKINILELNEENITELGKFDLIRMQHVLEHFTPEEAKLVLENCSKLLNNNGFLLISVPDLKLFIKYYKKNNFKNFYTFYNWANLRIEKDAPASFYFSIFTHSLLHEQHKWCYDFEGLKYMVNSTGKYKNIVELRPGNKLSSWPFTHKRPEEDLCILANKANN